MDGKIQRDDFKRTCIKVRLFLITADSFLCGLDLSSYMCGLALLVCMSSRLPGTDENMLRNDF